LKKRENAEGWKDEHDVIIEISVETECMWRRIMKLLIVILTLTFAQKRELRRIRCRNFDFFLSVRHGIPI
jgi:hypothetical protein